MSDPEAAPEAHGGSFHNATDCPHCNTPPVDPPDQRREPCQACVDCCPGCAAQCIRYGHLDTGRLLNSSDYPKDHLPAVPPEAKLTDEAIDQATIGPEGSPNGHHRRVADAATEKCWPVAFDAGLQAERTGHTYNFQTYTDMQAKVDAALKASRVRSKSLEDAYDMLKIASDGDLEAAQATSTRLAKAASLAKNVLKNAHLDGNWWQPAVDDLEAALSAKDATQTEP